MDLDERRDTMNERRAGTSRVLVTLLFSDLVGSTRRATEIGDHRWSALLDDHHSKVRSLIDRFDGDEVDCAGDGFFAIFTTASRAVECGLSITRSLAELGLEARVGVHTGECERLGSKMMGVAVHAAARVVRLADPSEVLVTTTVKGVAEGSGLRFTPRGSHALKGLPGVWGLYAAIDTARRAEPLTIAHLHATHRRRRRTTSVPTKQPDAAFATV
jgi:class 3 adenylate cyclase